jgi:hypothetical protein
MAENDHLDARPEETATSASWASAIPELFYDILARILPGFLALMLALGGYATIRLWLVDGRIGVAESLKEIPPSVLIPSAFLGMWITGLLLTYLGGRLNTGKSKQKTLERVFGNEDNKTLLALARREEIVSALPKGGLSDGNALLQQAGRIYQDIHEFLKARRVEWRSMLSKNQAEVTFYENVTAALVLYCVAMIVASVFLFCAYQADPSFLPILRGNRPLWIAISGAVLTAFVPALVALVVAWYSMHKKYDRLWDRHMSMLRVALRPRVVLAQAEAAAKPAAAAPKHQG